MFGTTTSRGGDRSRLVAGAAYLLGTAGLAFSISLLWLGMRVVMGVGGFCAEGGPFVIAVSYTHLTLPTN